MISVIVLTFNDEAQIGRCLESIKHLSDDVIVVDSFSDDRTLDICRGLGARVFQNPFANQAIQFNWALDNVPVRNEWILRLDSDEIVPGPLSQEISRRVGREAGVTAYALNRRMYWMGRWLRHGRMYPHRVVRLFRKGHARYEERTEEHLIVDGKIGFMQSDFLEDNRKNSLDYFIRKHLTTAQGELDEMLAAAGGRGASKPGIEPRLLGAKVHRTRWFKERVYARMPPFARPFLYFVYRYFICLGFLDGVPGLTFHVLQGFWYRFYIDALVYEQRAGQRRTGPDCRKG
ncbi:MAG: glycosyltransferase family 2 protein [Bauldia sp.]